MPIPQAFTANTNICNVARRWCVSIRLASKLTLAIHRIGNPPGISIISGHRSIQEQIDLCNDLEGSRPCADPATSTHTELPATGVDLRWEGAEDEDWRRLGEEFERLGGRWGGRFGDRNHFDLGKRKR